jgi:hypothetical protein
VLANLFEARSFISGAGSRLLNRLKSRFYYVTPRYFRYLSQTVVLTPWVMGVISLYLLGFVPQMHEVYIGVIEDYDVIRATLGLAALCGFSALLYDWNHVMVTRRIDGIYPDHADIYFDRGVLGIRDLKTTISSALPFAGLSIGLIAAFFQVRSAANHVKQVSDGLGGGLDQAEALQARLATLPGAILFFLAVAVAVSAALIVALQASRKHPRWHRLFERACYALTVLLVAAPILSSDLTLKASRAFGPLASTGLVLIGGAVFLRILIWSVARVLWVILTLPSLLVFSMRGLAPAAKQLVVVLLPMLLAVWGGVKLIRVLVPEDVPQATSILEELKERNQATNGKREILHKTFARWLHAREIGAGNYPIFIVTAEGGGIYAASAASFFLAQMEERCPSFSEHIFAISAVSGGSIGASLFDAALAEGGKGKYASKADGTFPACLEVGKPGRLFERLRRVTRDDHLSPVIAYILPDLLRDIRELFAGNPPRREPCKNEVPFEWFGRDQMLEKSFIASFAQSAKGDGTPAMVCPAAADANTLMRNFSDAWSPENKLPALLLNATWVETGYRVAFSPFPLQHLGEGTLYSFDDVGALPGQGHEASQSWQNPSLIGAAAVSARFPFVLPPWESSPSAKNRWTFVDGGYADASGATTGLELYKELKREISDGSGMPVLTDANGKGISPDQIILYLVVLSDAYVEPDFKKITGSSLDDFISPFHTVLTVRELLARRAVTQAYSEVGEKNLITIQLDQQTFPLSLGWKISALSSDIIRFALGRPDHCRPQKSDTKDWPVWTVNHNSCELRRIVDLLTQKPQPMPKAPPPASAPLISSAPIAPSPPVPAPSPPKTLGPWEVQPQ